METSLALCFKPKAERVISPLAGRVYWLLNGTEYYPRTLQSIPCSSHAVLMEKGSGFRFPKAGSLEGDSEKVR